MKAFFTTFLLLFSVMNFSQAQEGSPDKNFGANGTMLDTSMWADCRAMAVQPDGKLLTGGHTDSLSDNPYIGGLYVARFNKDGSIDEKFGTKGKVIIRNIEGVALIFTQAIAIQPDGKIIACGRFVPIHSFGHIGLLRLYPDGSVDSSFGNNGFVTTVLSKYDDAVSGMALQPDGKIVVAGKRGNLGRLGPDYLLRYMPDGSMDKSFGENGAVYTDYTTNVFLGAVELQPDGKILTGGTYGINILQFQIARYNTDGSLDQSFGEGGFARLMAKFGDFSELNDLAVQEDGTIIAAGNYGTGAMALARFDNSGKPDMSFGDQGGYTYF